MFTPTFKAGQVKSTNFANVTGKSIQQKINTKCFNWFRHYQQNKHCYQDKKQN
jgi:hypothetical protein